MSHEDQTGSVENQTTEQPQKEEVHLSPAVRKQAQDAINSGNQDKVDPAIKEKLLEEQAQKNHDPVPQPEPVEEPTMEEAHADLEAVEEAVSVVETPLHEAIFSDSFVVSEPRVKVQLIIPLISASTEDGDEDIWVEELEDGTPVSFKHTLANGSGKKGTLGIMYATVNNAIQVASELNSSNIKVANTDMTRQAMSEILASNLNERCEIIVPEELAESIVDRFEQTASFYPGVLASPLVEEDTVGIQIFTPIPLIATSDDKLVRYIELIEKYFGEFNTDIEIILLADPVETIFDDVQRENVRVAVEELGFAINTMDNLITAVEADTSFDLDEDLDDEEGYEGSWDEEDDDEDFDTDEDTGEESDDDEDVVEDEDEESEEESDSNDEFGFTLPQSMDRMSHLIRDENNLAGLGLIVLGKKL